MSGRARWIGFSILMLIWGGVVLAQGDCQALVQRAIQTAREQCAGLRVGDACYGHGRVSLIPRAGLDVGFQQPGDFGDVDAIEGLLQAGGVDAWGVTSLRIQPEEAQLPSSLVFFGGVSVQNRGSTIPPEVRVMVSGSVNLRSGPGTGYAIVGGLQAGDAVQAIGRNAASDWLVARQSTGQVAWVFAELVTPSASLSILPIVEADYDGAGSEYSAMQAFNFTSPADTASPCASVLPDGVLIQTSETAPALFRVNGINLWLTVATVYLRAVPDGLLTIDVLNGWVLATTSNGAAYGGPGMRLAVSLDAAGLAAGAPTGPSAIPDLAPYALPLPMVDAFSMMETDAATIAYFNQTPIEGIYRAEYADTTPTPCVRTFRERLYESFELVIRMNWAEDAIRWRYANDFVLRRVAGNRFAGEDSAQTAAGFTVRATYTLIVERPDVLQVAQNLDDSCPTTRGYTLRWLRLLDDQ